MPEILKQAPEEKSPKYPEDWSPPSKSPKKQKIDRLGAFSPTAYCKLLYPRNNSVQEPYNPNFKATQTPTI